ncbi:MAG: DUF5682 family protein [Microlunatus sp.]|nr:DUF5682 family protein [Microlunatus sp.]
MKPDQVEVAVFGVRHHGPGSARSLLAALTGFGPDQLLIEGPADADPLIAWTASPATQPPVAILAYAPSEPRRAAFWPFAAFSPEWQALTWALAHNVQVGFCDLPAAHTLAPETATPPSPDLLAGSEDDDENPGGTGPRRVVRRDPIAALAEAAGYDDPERWWDDVVESRSDGSSPFPALIDAMAELRVALPETDPAMAVTESRREAYMRKTIRARVSAGRRRVAVVCGAWHAPALTWPLPPASADNATLRGLPKTKVTTTWVPWTHARLSYASGYGAGIASPGWYDHLWRAPDRPVTRWLTSVAAALRTKDLPVSSAAVIEAVRLAESLAALRARPLAGLAEVNDATLAVLCDGDEAALRFVTDDLVIGQRTGRVDPGVPTVPLEADLLATCRRLRLKREASVKLHDLDLRRPLDRRRSVLFHRLRVLELGWAQPAESEVASRGTFRETWQSVWRPEFAIAVIEAAVWGTTVATAAAARLIDTSEQGSLAQITIAVERALLAELPDGFARLLAALAQRAALDVDIVHLMDALPALARAHRYSDVRNTDTSALASVAATLVVRICAGLVPAVSTLDPDSARAMRQRMDRVHRATGLLVAGLPEAVSSGAPPEAVSSGALPVEGESPRRRWLDALSGLLDRSDVPAEIAGRVVRMLFDADRIADGPARVHRALSYGASAGDKAAWVDGFFADGGLLLIHDVDLRGLVDGWVAELSDREFADVLPLIRRTFSTFTSPERRQLGERLATAGPGPGPVAGSPTYDLELAAPALTVVDRLLGLR